MSKRAASVVIGANFGDEGKGLVTDFLAAQGADTVVRFNGGAQAGHTVLTPQGQRHVFSHFGSGTLCGVPTFLSAFFVCNPVLYRRERQSLLDAGVLPVLRVDRASPVTTPYDMLINHIAEMARGASRHGSCGVGFGETLERDGDSRFRLRVADLADSARLADLLDKIRRDYVPQRLAALGLSAQLPENAALLGSDILLERFVADSHYFLGTITLADAGHLRSLSHIVFEGAQGLLLDQQRGFFPHVTRSHTGLRNVLSLAAEAHLPVLQVIYASRAYLTRHGAGPMPNEVRHPPYSGIIDETNIHNSYQGGLRFGLLDLDVLTSSIHADLQDAQGTQIAVEPMLALTCMDQIGSGRARYRAGGMPCEAAAEVFAQRVMQHCALPQAYVSGGPTRLTMSAIQGGDR